MSIHIHMRTNQTRNNLHIKFNFTQDFYICMWIYIYNAKVFKIVHKFMFKYTNGLINVFQQNPTYDELKCWHSTYWNNKNALVTPKTSKRAFYFLSRMWIFVEVLLRKKHLFKMRNIDFSQSMVLLIEFQSSLIGNYQFINFYEMCLDLYSDE